MNYSLNSLYRTIGISKQAVNQYAKKQAVFDTEVSKLVLEADDLRREHPGCGVEKMYYTLKPSFIGRDKFIDVFMNLGYRLHKRKNYIKTTIASKIYYPNLIKGMQVNAPSTIWQSDITYIRIKDVFYYAVFIIDVYTKKIVGYHVSDNMRAQANIEALKMAFKYNTPPLIHHSDRGSQYTYKGYIQLLKTKGVNISMALSAQDNAYAERINRTIKNDYLAYWKPKSFCELKRLIKKAVNQYNNTRPHNSIDKMTPVEFENKWFGKSTFSKPFITIFNNEVNV
ncbi:IS3 family transposase [Myroides sp. NP-2]|nr:IS3 family transposase [Myroides sp. NP-2]